MKMSPIKKIVIGLAVITVAISLITANNMASVMLIVASREAGASTQQTAQGNNGASQSQSNGDYQDGTVSGGTASDSTASGSDTPAASVNGSAGGSDSGSSSSGTAGGSSTDKPAASDKGQTGSSASGKLSDQQIVDLYKKAVSNARTKSSSVVRVKDGALNYKGIAEAGKLSSAASTLMGLFMVSSANDIEVKNEAWDKTKLPDASALTTAGLKKITCTENGGKYIVTLVAKDAKSPKAGSDGVGSIASVIEDSQITGAIGSVPGLTLSGINVDYENVTTVATIDKATGNLVAMDIDAPCILTISQAKIPIIGQVDNAKVGIEVITQYTVAY